MPGLALLGPAYEGQDRVETETIGVPAGHRFWSEDRQAFLPIGEFEIGEHLLTANGSLATVRSLTKRPQRETVYNIEVDGEHVYAVGNEGLLTHNICGFGIGQMTGRYRMINGTWRVAGVGKNGRRVWRSFSQ